MSGFLPTVLQPQLYLQPPFRPNPLKSKQKPCTVALSFVPLGIGCPPGPLLPQGLGVRWSEEQLQESRATSAEACLAGSAIVNSWEHIKLSVLNSPNYAFNLAVIGHSLYNSGVAV